VHGHDGLAFAALHDDMGALLPQLYAATLAKKPEQIFAGQTFIKSRVAAPYVKSIDRCAPSPELTYKLGVRSTLEQPLGFSTFRRHTRRETWVIHDRPCERKRGRERFDGDHVASPRKRLRGVFVRSWFAHTPVVPQGSPKSRRFPQLDPVQPTAFDVHEMMTLVVRRFQLWRHETCEERYFN
jgi:hypothetical protein